MSKHTPGPWEVGMYDQVISESGRVADCLVTGMHFPECRANARLIAAAPDMLETLEECLALEAWEFETKAPPLIAGAIAKATGES